MSFVIRPVRPSDAEAIEVVRSAGWRASYRGLIDDAYLDTFHGDAARRRDAISLAGPESVQVVAVEGDSGDGEVIGWSGGGPTRDDDHAALGVQELYSCYVDPARWGSGVGGAIFEHVVTELATRGPRVSLWVLTGNQRARRFYEAHGFVADGAEKPTDFPGRPLEMRYLRES